jgi:hypothetical protein
MASEYNLLAWMFWGQITEHQVTQVAVKIASETGHKAVSTTDNVTATPETDTASEGDSDERSALEKVIKNRLFQTFCISLNCSI